jgi:simple sugar transport system ATP-binding protein
LTVRDVSINGDRGNQAVSSATFQIFPGEVVGIAGVDGSGQRELFQALLGVRKLHAGTISLAGEDVTVLPSARRIAAGIRIIPEDRHEEGVVNDWSLEENSLLGLQRLSGFSANGSINLKSRTSWTEKIADRFATKRGSVKQPMASLSGGNQQRFVVARALESGGTVLLAFQPTRGLDLAASAKIFSAFRQAAAEGKAVLLVSYDLDELLAHSDRILVMNRGKLTEAQTMTRDAIGDLMVAA